MTVDSFISVDWGTTNFRVRIIDVPSLKVREVIESENGVKKLYSNWLTIGGNQEQFYLDFLNEKLINLTQRISHSTPILISGMASSSIGLKELPYANIPFKTDGSSLYIDQIKQRTFLISGVKSKTDVIRGEEVQMLGLAHLSETSKRNIFILPGTHSKHIICEKDEVVDFKTFMTGEIFEVIAHHTILKNSIEFGNLNENRMSVFEEGIKEAQNGISILNSLFKVRTNSLFNKMNAIQNYYFLSGLVIGEELKSIVIDEDTVLHLCAGAKLFELYKKAIQVLELDKITNIIPEEIVDSAVIRGQYKMLEKLKYK